MNCRTCNIAAPQYELFDGLCGKCLLRITRDLLAVIHRDGGQYTEQHGLEVSAKSAGEISIGRLVTAEESQKQAAAMTSCLEHIKTLSLECREDPKIVLQAVGLSAIGGLQSDAGRDYVSKKSVKPIAEALEWCCRRMDHGNELDGQCIEKAQHARKMIQSLGLLDPSPQKPVDT